MMNRRLWVCIMAGILALVMVLGMIFMIVPTPANAATSSSELKQQLDALKAQKAENDAKIAELKNQYQANLDEFENIVAQKSVLDQEIFTLHDQVTNINSQIATYTLMIADKQAELDEAQARLDELTEQNKARIRAMEENGKLSYWSVLFRANSFADLLDRLNMIEEIAAADQRRLKEMSEAAEAVQKAKAELETEKEALEQTKQELEASRVELETKRTEADELLAKLIETGAEFDSLLDKAEQDASDLSDKISDKKDEYDDAKYQEWLATSVPPTTRPPQFAGGAAGEGNTVGGKTWLIPCNYSTVSSPYGWRIHPVYGDQRFHNGVDLAAGTGTPIIATRSGIVSIAMYSWSAGYYVAIDHRDGFESKYMHMTHYIVSVGQYVSAGQVIGYVGSTGISTGPHLHFGISYAGTYVNPLAYI